MSFYTASSVSSVNIHGLGGVPKANVLYIFPMKQWLPLCMNAIMLSTKGVKLRHKQLCVPPLDTGTEIVFRFRSAKEGMHLSIKTMYI